MILIMAVIHGDHVNKINRRLMDENFRFTTLASSGGFLKAKNETLLLGIKEDELDNLVAILKEECENVNIKHGVRDGREVKENTVNLFVMNMEQFKRM